MLKVCVPFTTHSSEHMNWDYILSNFSPDEIFILCTENCVLPNTNVMGQGTAIYSLSELPQNVDHILLSPINAHEPDMVGTVSLLTFTHPIDAIYIVGFNNHFIGAENFEGGKLPDYFVYIPTDTEDEMFNWVAMAICLYDRKVKNG